MDSPVLRLIAEFPGKQWTVPELADRLSKPRPTVTRWVSQLVNQGQLVRAGAGRSTAYSLAPAVASTAAPAAAAAVAPAQNRLQPQWSPQAQTLLAYLRQPKHSRKSVTYQREFVDAYVPNVTRLLARPLAMRLRELGALSGQRPAGTYARNVLRPLLIDLSWSSSKLEGNTYTLLDTERLFDSGEALADKSPDEAVMLLNHKAAIEFMVEEVPDRGLTVSAITNLHALLMQGLLYDPAALGRVRQRVVDISGTAYFPMQMPQVLEEMLGQVVDKACQISDPLEAAFFLWVNIAYLQPFEDGNKRTSRLACNIPLLLANFSPLAFLNVDESDYALAMLGVYERLDTSAAADLFAFAYGGSTERYAAVRKALGEPNQFRLRYRNQMSEAVQQIVRDRLPLERALANLHLPTADRVRFIEMTLQELAGLATYNCARYRLRQSEVDDWVKQGRPR